MLNKNNEFVLPKAVTKVIKTVCNARNSHKSSKLRPPHLLIPIDSGDGRSSLINALTDCYDTFGVIEFSSRDHYMEFKLIGTVGNVNDTYREIQENAEYSNHYRGIVGLGFDALLTRLNEVVAEKVFDMIDKVKRYATIVIFVPSDCSKKNLDIIASKIGVSLRLMPAVEYSANEYASVFFDYLPFDEKSITRYITAKQAVTEYITEALVHPTMRGVIELAESMVFNESAIKKLFGKSEIERGDL